MINMKNILAIAVIFLSFPVLSQVPLNWTRDEVNPGEDFTLTPDGSVFSEGLKSCHMQLNSGSIPYLESDVFYISPGAPYVFSFDVFDNDTAGQVKVYADFYDVYGFNVFGEAPFLSADSSEWQSVSWTGTVPAQAAVGYVLIKFYNQPNPYSFTKTAHIWLDNFQYRQDGGDNLIVNGGFEDWLVGVDEPGREEGFLAVYPNPASNIMNIRNPGETDFITVNDIAGREVLRIYSEGQDIIRADISHLPTGFYIVTAIQKNHPPVASKLLID
jgi:hypothetical protein